MLAKHCPRLPAIYHRMLDLQVCLGLIVVVIVSIDQQLGEFGSMTDSGFEPSTTSTVAELDWVIDGTSESDIGSGRSSLCLRGGGADGVDKN